MLKIDGRFSKNEMYFIKTINKILESKIPLNGIIQYEGYFVVYNACVTDEEDSDNFILKFCVKDEVEEGDKFVHISSIVIPHKYRHQNIATAIVLAMSYIANVTLNIYFYVTCIVNERWKSNLIELGGIEDEDGDIEILYDNIAIHLEQKYRNKLQ